MAIVTRNWRWRGVLVFAMTKRVETIIPPQAEAETINWATQRALKFVWRPFMENCRFDC